MTIIFDTSSLLLLADNLFREQRNNHIVITSITLKELERIKTSANKDANIKYAARRILHQLDENPDKFECYIYNTTMNEPLEKYNLEINDDAKILAAAYDYSKHHRFSNIYFYTNDLALKQIARLFFKDKIGSINEKEQDSYTGYLDISFTEKEMADFYTNPTKYGNKLALNTNQYLNIFDINSGDCVDHLCWTGTEFRPVRYKAFESKQLGLIKPYKDDPYQAIAADSLLNNKITLIKGKPGSGKSTLSLGFLFYCLEKGKIDHIIIFCNPVATKNAARLGFYPGDKNDKLLDSQVGNFLTGKLGSKMEVEQLIHNEKLILLPMSDIRGFDTTGMQAGIYITEAQNLDITLLKLALQRAGEDAIFILDGDVKSQVDLIDYEGANNGLRRVSQVFRGEDIYGEVELQNIHRSRIAEIAEKL